MERIIKSAEYDYITTLKATALLCERYPFLKQFKIGKSCGGKDINALEIEGTGEAVLIAAAFHGSEYITTNVLLYFIEELCEAIKFDTALSGVNVKKALMGRGIVFVPLVNPDGVEISIHGALAFAAQKKELSLMCKGDFKHWNANLRGVDINHNFNAGWQALRERERQSGIYGPAPTRFGGYKPESEPETLSLVSLCRKRPFHHILALHSQGEVIYYDGGKTSHYRATKMAEIMATVSGYALDVPTGLALGGGFKDWYSKEFDRPSFTIELGLGKNPLPTEQAAAIYEGVREMLTLSLIM